MHFLAYLPRVLGSLRFDWSASRRRNLPGAQLRALAIAAALGAGAVLAVAVLPLITGWHGGHH